MNRKFSLPFLLGSGLFLCLQPVFAGNGQDINEWYSAEGNPEVTVYLDDKTVYAQTFSNIPAVELQKVNSELLATYGEQYVRLEDFNHDGNTDIGVLEGAGLAGSNLCYQVYEYLPVIFSYNDSPTFDVCRNVAGSMSDSLP